MNVEAGDIARIVHPDAYGRIVLVRLLITSPDHHFPDGWHARDSVGLWEIEMQGSPIECWRFEKDRGYFRELIRFGACEDKWLRPLRDPGADATDEMLQLLGAPDSAGVEWALGVAG
jgi:hypothetical protein